MKKRQERIAAQLEEKGGYAALNEQLKKKENTLNERDELAKQERIKKQKALSRQRLNQNPSQFAEEPLFFAPPDPSLRTARGSGMSAVFNLTREPDTSLPEEPFAEMIANERMPTVLSSPFQEEGVRKNQQNEIERTRRGGKGQPGAIKYRRSNEERQEAGEMAVQLGTTVEEEKKRQSTLRHDRYGMMSEDFKPNESLKFI